jgi:thiol-disulfide isomerase/thioredoxin
MRRIYLGFILFAIVWKVNIAQVSTSASIPVLNFEQFEPFLHYHNDTTYLINFWATWCAPCRQEIPAIEKVGDQYSDKKFRIILVSMDFKNQLESQLVPFIQSHQIKSRVVMLHDPDQNRWIDKVDPGWSGEIPFTVIYGKDFRGTYNKSFNYNELDSIINLKLKTR